jgi:hypothetical protein
LEIFYQKFTYIWKEQNNQMEVIKMNPMNQVNQMNSPQQGPVPNPYLNNFAPMGAQTPFYSQPILQPAGMVYIISSSQELSTIPTQPGLNLYWCGNENKIYIRHFANGMVETKEFFLSTSQNTNNPNSNMGTVAGADMIEDIPTELFDKLNTRLTSIERSIRNLKGGEPEWQI